MLKRRKILIWAACCLMAVGSLAFVLRPFEKEPSYHSRTLSQWLAMDPYYEPEVNEAVQKIGTNAIPFLLNWIPFEASPAQRILGYQMSLRGQSTTS